MSAFALLVLLNAPVRAEDTRYDAALRGVADVERFALSVGAGARACASADAALDTVATPYELTVLCASRDHVESWRDRTASAVVRELTVTPEGPAREGLLQVYEALRPSGYLSIAGARTASTVKAVSWTWLGAHTPADDVRAITLGSALLNGEREALAPRTPTTGATLQLAVTYPRMPADIPEGARVERLYSSQASSDLPQVWQALRRESPIDGPVRVWLPPVALDAVLVLRLPEGELQVRFPRPVRIEPAPATDLWAEPEDGYSGWSGREPVPHGDAQTATAVLGELAAAAGRSDAEAVSLASDRLLSVAETLEASRPRDALALRRVAELVGQTLMVGDQTTKNAIDLEAVEDLTAWLSQENGRHDVATRGSHGLEATASAEAELRVAAAAAVVALLDWAAHAVPTDGPGWGGMVLASGALRAADRVIQRSDGDTALSRRAALWLEQGADLQTALRLAHAEGLIEAGATDPDELEPSVRALAMILRTQPDPRLRGEAGLAAAKLLRAMPASKANVVRRVEILLEVVGSPDDPSDGGDAASARKAAQLLVDLGNPGRGLLYEVDEAWRAEGLKRILARLDLVEAAGAGMLYAEMLNAGYTREDGTTVASPRDAARATQEAVYRAALNVDRLAELTGQHWVQTFGPDAAATLLSSWEVDDYGARAALVGFLDNQWSSFVAGEQVRLPAEPQTHKDGPGHARLGIGLYGGTDTRLSAPLGLALGISGDRGAFRWGLGASGGFGSLDLPAGPLDLRFGSLDLQLALGLGRGHLSLEPGGFVLLYLRDTVSTSSHQHLFEATPAAGLGVSTVLETRVGALQVQPRLSALPVGSSLALSPELKVLWFFTPRELKL